MDIPRNEIAEVKEGHEDVIALDDEDNLIDRAKDGSNGNQRHSRHVDLRCSTEIKFTQGAQNPN